MKEPSSPVVVIDEPVLVDPGDLVHPEPLHGVEVVHGLGDGEEDAAHHAGELLQAEHVVGVVRGGQQVGDHVSGEDLFVFTGTVS